DALAIAAIPVIPVAAPMEPRTARTVDHQPRLLDQPSRRAVIDSSALFQIFDRVDEALEPIVCLRRAAVLQELFHAVERLDQRVLTGVVAVPVPVAAMVPAMMGRPELEAPDSGLQGLE